MRVAAPGGALMRVAAPGGQIEPALGLAALQLSACGGCFDPRPLLSSWLYDEAKPTRVKAAAGCGQQQGSRAPCMPPRSG